MSEVMSIGDVEDEALLMPAAFACTTSGSLSGSFLTLVTGTFTLGAFGGGGGTSPTPGDGGTAGGGGGIIPVLRVGAGGDGWLAGGSAV